ncbi:hypothetical protein EHN06_08975 [Marinobacter sp. NP-4(2019)]|uniref:hypothetical protein n=1 Tax=Marinobacter sp. NP-4(2019) TaxID=2488665 RepID=UPI000FC3ECF3|nr:hypothetical protein [Marinobacter sp. NP-4(2019)]AZT83660.1 hypothetical protein EHN06_08975 [Marinobacter sp. NP-4(2019)]
MYEKIVLIVLGAALGKVIDIYLQRRKVSHLQTAIIEELEDIKDRLFLVCRAYERAIQIFALGGFSPDLPLKLSNPMFKKHYSDIAIKLGASQRKSFSLIDSYVDAINDGIAKVEAAHPGTAENLSEDILDRWGDLLKGQYHNAATAYWHVNYHLSNKELPYLGDEGSEVHKAYLAQLESSEDHLKKLIEGARGNLTRDDF